jgi:hypothetical protein
MGDVVDFPLRVLRPRSTSVARWWEASFEPSARVLLRFGERSRSSNSGEPSRVPSASAAGSQRGGFVAEIVASAPIEASRKRSFPCFGPGSNEARCERCSRAVLSLVTACPDGSRLRPTPD